MPVVTMPNLRSFIEGEPAPPRSGERQKLPEEFEHRVRHALESSIRYSGRALPEADAQRRRDRMEAWLEELRWNSAYDRWCQNLRETLARRDSVQDEEREAADARAEALLRSSLTPDQLRELNQRNYFHVTVGERRFRICRGRSHNVKEVDAQSRILYTLCAHPTLRVPNADTMLGQKLILETNPGEFFRLANVTRRRHRQSRQFNIGYWAIENLNIARELRRQRVAASLDVSALTQEEAA